MSSFSSTLKIKYTWGLNYLDIDGFLISFCYLDPLYVNDHFAHWREQLLREKLSWSTKYLILISGKFITNKTKNKITYMGKEKKNQGFWCQRTGLIKNILLLLEKLIQQVSLK